MAIASMLDEREEHEHLTVLAARAASSLSSIASRLDELGGAPDDLLDELALTLERCRSSLDAAQGGVLVAMDTAAACRSRHGLSAAGFVARQTRQRPNALVELAMLAAEARELPVVNAFWGWGDIARRHVRVLVDAARDRREAFAEDELLLCKWALTLRFKEFVKQVHAWIESVDPQGADERAQRIERDRWARVALGYDGVGILQGQLTPRCRAQFGGELLRLAQLLLDDDWAEARARLGPTACKADLRRTDRQRAHDALQLMAERSAAHDGASGTGTPCADLQPGSPSGGTEPAETGVPCRPTVPVRPAATPAVVVHIDARTFEAHLAWMADGGTALGPPKDSMCELADGTRLTRRQFLDIALVAHIRTLVYDATPTPVATGKPGSLYRGRLRQTVVDLQRECGVDGCEWPGVHCDVDHVQPRDQGGPTTLANAQLLCPVHHRMRHHGFIHPVRGPDGIVRWVTRHDRAP
jgi:hypothetical protein